MYQVSSLDNGLCTVADSELGVASFTVCVAVNFSARHETPAENGISHLLEHLVMSAPSDSFRQPVSDWASSVGGQANAMTSKDLLMFWVRVPAESAIEAASRLFDAVASPQLTAELVATERRVVVEELISAAADPFDCSTELFYATLFRGHPLAAPVGGVVDFPDYSVAAIAQRHQRGLDSGRVFVGTVGAQPLMEPALQALRRSPLGQPRPRVPVTEQPPVAPAEQVELTCPPDAEFVYLTAGGFGASRSDPYWASFEVLAALIGGLPGSLLYSRLRGELGMSYQVFSMTTTLSDVGIWRVLAGCTPANLATVHEVIRSCLVEVVAGKVAPELIEAARRQSLGAAILDHEDPVARVYNNLFHVAQGQRAATPQDFTRDRLAAVDDAQLAAAAERVLASYTAVVAG